ncbi:MAG: YqgE/AlgH family protein [Pseudomonadota bacterium]
MEIRQSFSNQLLVALPALKGDYFEGSVSLLVDHNDDGAFGLMINRPLKTRLVELFPDLAGRFDCPVMEGGPVEQNRVFFLHEAGPVFESTFVIGDEVALTTSADFIDAMKAREAPERSLALLGYAGWSAHQLEHEIAEDVWLLTPASKAIVFDVAFEERAVSAAAMLGVDLNLLSSAPGTDQEH